MDRPTKRTKVIRAEVALYQPPAMRKRNNNNATNNNKQIIDTSNIRAFLSKNNNNNINNNNHPFLDRRSVVVINQSNGAVHSNYNNNNKGVVVNRKNEADHHRRRRHKKNNSRIRPRLSHISQNDHLNHHNHNSYNFKERYSSNRNSYRRKSSPSYNNRLSNRQPPPDNNRNTKKRFFSRSRSRSQSERCYSSVDSFGRRRHHSTSHRSYADKSMSTGSSDIDDEYGHFEGGSGTVIDKKYKILKDVGKGTFGRVVRCQNLDYEEGCGRPTHVAIKIVRDVKRYFESAKIEADIVKDVNSRGRRGVELFSQMYECFDFQGHFCLVFECLGRSLYDFVKSHNYKPFPLFCVKDFARQLLDAIEFLHSFNLIHTDLKLENVLLVNNKEVEYVASDGIRQWVPLKTDIKVIDFGGATYDDERKSSIINTRQYRAPEVILGGLGWSLPSDIWSLGCIIMELYRGDLLFATHDNIEHLALIEQVIGPFPDKMIDESDLGRDVFNTNRRHRWELLSSSSKRHVQRARTLESLIRFDDKSSGLFELIRGLLKIDPSDRITAKESLRMEFVQAP